LESYFSSPISGINPINKLKYSPTCVAQPSQKIGRY
jgi:hypothetical protein